MAEPTDEYCVTPTDEVAEARKLTFEADKPEKVHYTTEEKLMRPGSENIEG